MAHEYPLNAAGASKKASGQQLADLLGFEKAALSSAYTNSTVTGTEVTGLSKTLVAGTYRFSYYLIIRSAATGTGPGFGINYTGTATSLVATLYYQGTGTTASTGVVDDANTGVAAEQVIEGCVTITESTTAPNLNVLTGVGAAGADCAVFIEGVIVTSDGGDLELWANSETATVQIDVRAGSNLLICRCV